jgi:hypothetical protein
VPIMPVLPKDGRRLRHGSFGVCLEHRMGNFLHLRAPERFDTRKVTEFHPSATLVLLLLIHPEQGRRFGLAKLQYGPGTLRSAPLKHP